MKILGQDPRTVKNQILAMFWNVISWWASWLPSFLRLSPRGPPAWNGKDENFCIAIHGPGGLDALRMVNIPGDSAQSRATVGYNVPSLRSPYVSTTSNLDPNLVVVRNKYFSVNYADVCIRWG